MATLEQLIIFFLLIGVGVIARKVGVGWVCRLCAPSLLCTGEMPLPVVKVASIHLASPLRCKRIKRRTIRLQTLSLELTKLSGRRQPDDMSV